MSGTIRPTAAEASIIDRQETEGFDVSKVAVGADRIEVDAEAAGQDPSVEVDDMPGPSEVEPGPGGTDRQDERVASDWNQSTISCRAASGTTRQRGG